MDGNDEMTPQELRAYHREQKKLMRNAQRELEERQQLESTKGPRLAKTKALGEKVWLSEKRPGEVNEHTVQKKIKVSTQKGKASTARNPTEGNEEKAKSAAPEPARQQQRAPPRRPRTIESDSSELSELDLSDNDDDVALEDDDGYLKSLTDKELESLVGQRTSITIDGKADAKRAPAASSIFDIPDNEVTMVPSRAPSRASSRASVPPLSDYDDQHHDANELDERSDQDSDSSESLLNIPKRKSRTHTGQKDKKISKHEEKFEREQPKIKTPQTATLEKRSKASATSFQRSKSDADDDSKWPDWTHIIYTDKSKIQLLKQHPVIKSVVRDAIELAETDVVTRLAWPELKTSRELYRRQILYQAAKSLEKKDNRAQDVKERVKGSMKYSAALGDLVMDRLSVARSPARTAALSHIACFELGVHELCQQRFTALVENDLYIYPGIWQTQEIEEKNEKTGKMEQRKKPLWVISDRSLIYQNKGFKDSLKDAFFEMKGSFGFKYQHHFKSTLEGRDEPELTIPIVALGATGFYAALHSWSSGRFNKKEKFEGELFNTVFERHVQYLEQIKEDNHIAFHVIMSRLFAYVTQGSTNNGGNSGTSNALKVVDLSGYE